MKGLTERQQEIYNYLISYFIKTSRLPHLAQIAEEYAMNKRAAFEIVGALIAKGYISKTSNGDLMLSEKDKSLLINTKIPSFDNEKEYSYIAKAASKGRDCFFLRIFSDEMRNIGLMMGDEAIFEKTEEAENGDIVLCSLEDREQMMLRRLFIRTNGLYDLVPENDTMGKTTANKVIIHGRLIMSMRRYID